MLILPYVEPDTKKLKCYFVSSSINISCSPHRLSSSSSSDYSITQTGTISLV
jgi:hypothetical protein